MGRFVTNSWEKEILIIVSRGEGGGGAGGHHPSPYISVLVQVDVCKHCSNSRTINVEILKCFFVFRVFGRHPLYLVLVTSDSVRFPPEGKSFFHLITRTFLLTDYT